jgi:hypothetical protein
VAGSIAALAALSSLPPAPAGASPSPALRKQVSTLAPGVTYTRITDTSVPLRTYVVTLDPSRAASLDVEAAGSTFGRYSPTSSIASGEGALAGINGDFSSDGMPVHAFAEEAALKTDGSNVGATFAISRDEAHRYLRSGVKAVITGVNAANGRSFAVHGWNSEGPRHGEIAAFTAVGGSVRKPPSGACSARLLPSSGYRWGPTRRGVVRDYTVDVMRCQGDPVSASGGVVLSADRDGPAADQVRAMNPGGVVTLTWDIDDWVGVGDVVGGAPQLLASGRVVTDDNCGTYFCSRNPRSGIGYTEDGKILLVVVDGRSSSSIGVTPVGFAHVFKNLGATSALNLDGGGGATMWVKGKGVVNVPSDGSERVVSNAVLVLPGADRNEPATLARSRMRLASRSEAAAAEAASLADPASTGGLLDLYGG